MGSSGIHGVDRQIFREGRFCQPDRLFKPALKKGVPRAGEKRVKAALKKAWGGPGQRARPSGEERV